MVTDSLLQYGGEPPEALVRLSDDQFPASARGPAGHRRRQGTNRNNTELRNILRTQYGHISPKRLLISLTSMFKEYLMECFQNGTRSAFRWHTHTESQQYRLGREFLLWGSEGMSARLTVEICHHSVR